MDDLYTDWYDRSQKPKRIGVFMRNYFGKYWYSYWNGTYWGWLCAMSHDAAKYRLEKSKHQELPWRGLKRNPE